MSKQRPPSITRFRSQPWLAYGDPMEIKKWRVLGEDQIDGVELQHLKKPDEYALAHRATSGDRAWQVTWFDERGAGGDVRRRTLEEALNDGASPYKYDVRAVHLIADRAMEHTMAKTNPSAPTKAIRMFRRFHTRDWRGEGDFHRDLEIPEHVACLGDAKHVLYASDKLNPETGEDEGWIEYIHEHSSGVHVYQPVPRASADLELVRVPAWIRNVDQFTWLGRCLGFQYKDERGRACDVKGTQPLPELYAIPSGKALVVIQSKRKLLAMIWGGKLAVERRGIVH